MLFQLLRPSSSTAGCPDGCDTSPGSPGDGLWSHPAQAEGRQGGLHSQEPAGGSAQVPARAQQGHSELRDKHLDSALDISIPGSGLAGVPQPDTLPARAASFSAVPVTRFQSHTPDAKTLNMKGLSLKLIFLSYKLHKAWFLIGCTREPLQQQLELIVFKNNFPTQSSSSEANRQNVMTWTLHLYIYVFIYVFVSQAPSLEVSQAGLDRVDGSWGPWTDLALGTQHSDNGWGGTKPSFHS